MAITTQSEFTLVGNTNLGEVAKSALHFFFCVFLIGILVSNAANGSPSSAKNVSEKKLASTQVLVEDPLIDLVDTNPIFAVRVITNDLSFYSVPPTEEDILRDGCIHLSVEPKEIQDLSRLIRSSGITVVDRKWGGSPSYAVYFYLRSGSTIRLLLDVARGPGKTVKGWFESKQVMAEHHLIENLKKWTNRVKKPTGNCLLGQN